MRLLSEIRNYMGNYHLKSGVYHYYRSEFRPAVDFLRKALADEASLSDGDRPKARGYLTRALKGLGEKLAAEGDVGAGVEQLRRAIDVDGSYPDVHFLLAGLLQRSERLEQAIESYRQAIACHPAYLDAHVELGDCLIKAGRREEASQVLRRAMALKLEAIRRPFRQGMEWLDAGREAAARECFHEVFRSVPQLSKAHLEKALEWLRGEEQERALESLDRALDLSPNYPDLHNLRGIVLCDLEHYEAACAAFRRSAELCPGQLVPRLNLAFAYLRAERLPEGEAQLAAILERDPGEPVARAKLEELRAARALEKPGAGARS